MKDELQKQKCTSCEYKNTYGWRFDSPAQVGWQKLPVPDNDILL